MKGRYLLNVTLFLLCLISIQANAQTIPQVVNSDLSSAPNRNNFQVIVGQSYYRTFGSGFLVTPRVAATAAHVIFNDTTLSWETQINLMEDERVSNSHLSTEGNLVSMALSGYASRVIADNSPGISSAQTFNRDFAVLQNSQGISPFSWDISYNDETSLHPLLNSQTKTLFGFPRDNVSTSNLGKLHTTSLGTNPFEAAQTGDDPFGNLWAIYKSDTFEAVGGNSGGPITVAGTPAGIIVGSNQDTSYARGFNTEIRNLINTADISAGGPGFGEYDLPNFLRISENQEFFPGESINLTALVTQNGTTTYQWFKNGVLIPGKTTTTLALVNMSESDAGEYFLRASNAFGISDSVRIQINQIPPPAFTNTFEDLVLIYGTHYNLIAEVEDERGTSFQWFKNGEKVINAINSPHDLYVFDEAPGEWHVVATNPSGSIESPHFQITTYGFTQTFFLGAFSIGETATITAPIQFRESSRYQWYYAQSPSKPFTLLTGETDRVLSIENIQGSDEGYYYMNVTETTSGSTKNSDTYLLTIKWPIFYKQTYPEEIPKINLGESIRISTTFEGHYITFRYQWYFNNEAIEGETNESIYINFLSQNTAGNYHVVATDRHNFTAESPIYSLQLKDTIDQVYNLEIAPNADNTPLVFYQPTHKGLSKESKLQYPNSLQVVGDVVLFNYAESHPIDSSPFHFTSSNGLLSMVWADGMVQFASGPGESYIEKYIPNTIKVASSAHGPIALNANSSVSLWNVTSDTIIQPPSELSDKKIVDIKAYDNLVWAKDINNLLWQWNIETGEVTQPASNDEVQDFSMRKTNKAILLKNGTVLQKGFQYTTLEEGVEIEVNDPIPEFESPPIEIEVTDNFTAVLQENGEVKIWGKMRLPENTSWGEEGSLFELPAMTYKADFLLGGSRFIHFGSSNGSQYQETIVPANIIADQGKPLTLWKIENKIKKSYKWRFNFKDLTPSAVPFLTIDKFNQENVGYYNSGGSNSLFIHIKDKPMYFREQPKDLYIYPGTKTINFKVVSKYNTETTMILIKDGLIIASGFEDYIRHEFQEEDSGIYTAVITYNGASVYSEPFLIQVENEIEYLEWAEKNDIEGLWDSVFEDNDSDGMSNILEFQLGTNPNKPDAPKVLIQSNNGIDHAIVSANPKRIMPEGYRFIMKWSLDMKEWRTAYDYSYSNHELGVFRISMGDSDKFFYKLLIIH